jgi:hypothetical protein
VRHDSRHGGGDRDQAVDVARRRPLLPRHVRANGCRRRNFKQAPPAAPTAAAARVLSFCHCRTFTLSIEIPRRTVGARARLKVISSSRRRSRRRKSWWLLSESN